MQYCLAVFLQERRSWFFIKRRALHSKAGLRMVAKGTLPTPINKVPRILHLCQLVSHRLSNSWSKSLGRPPNLHMWNRPSQKGEHLSWCRGTMAEAALTAGWARSSLTTHLSPADFTPSTCLFVIRRFSFSVLNLFFSLSSFSVLNLFFSVIN